MTSRDILGCVVAFEPNDDSVAKIRTLRAELPNLLVVDNSLSPEAIDKVAGMCAGTGIQLLQNGQNVGQAEALNQGARWSRDHGYRYILFFDQDTRVLPGFLTDLLDHLGRLPAEPERALVGCDYMNARRQGRRYSSEFSKKRTVITTGSLVSIRLWEQVGRFRSDFFIDQVDDEFSLRVRRAGGTVIRINNPLIEHSIGNVTKSRWALNHSPFRWYHMTRNHVWTLREYLFFDPVWSLYTIALKARLILGTLMHERDLGPKVRAMLKGTWDGFTTRPERHF